MKQVSEQVGNPGGALSGIQCPHCGKLHPSTIWNCPETGGDLSGNTDIQMAGRSSSLSAKLILEDGNEIPLNTDGQTIGRDDFDRIVSAQDLPFISRRHLLISFEDDTYHIEDPGSKNGTSINGLEISGNGKYELKDGDQIVLGKVIKLEYRSK
jgi:pSer/pThr/pTyr-binding forkhead associated (FHA) protein